MKIDIFIPEKLKVGFQEREDTYTGQLAYVIYFDTKGVLRKEKSWESWRDGRIDPMEVENIPTSGFVLNKKAGGYSTGWNHRQTYVRIYDPRGFEFEITVPNLLYILENTNSIKGKGLEGEFIYGWSGTELLLIPTSSPDYKELSEFNAIVHQKTTVKAKELILGATYKTKQNEDVVYLGRFDCYDSYYGKPEGKKYFFRHLSNSTYKRFETLKTLGDKIITVVSEDCISNYADLIDELEMNKIYSPHDKSKDEYKPYVLKEFAKDVMKTGYYNCFTDKKVPVRVFQSYEHEGLYEVKNDSTYQKIMVGSIEEIFKRINPLYVNHYLTNGKLYRVKAQDY